MPGDNIIYCMMVHHFICQFDYMFQGIAHVIVVRIVGSLGIL
jgi:hypothetical protein